MAKVDDGSETLYTRVAGVSFRPRGGTFLCALQKGKHRSLYLSPEPKNRFDRNAVRLLGHDARGRSVHIGYVPRIFSERVARALGQGVKVTAKLIDPPTAKLKLVIHWG